jgi:hypothetical protein
MITENVHSLILQKKANGLATVELYAEGQPSRLERAGGEWRILRKISQFEKENKRILKEAGGTDEVYYANEDAISMLKEDLKKLKSEKLKSDKKLARLENLTDVTLKNVKDVETIMISDDIEVTFERPVTCVAEKDEVYSNMATTRPILAGISNPMGLTCGVPE